MSPLDYLSPGTSLAWMVLLLLLLLQRDQLELQPLEVLQLLWGPGDLGKGWMGLTRPSGPGSTGGERADHPGRPGGHWGPGRACRNPWRGRGQLWRGV